MFTGLSAFPLTPLRDGLPDQAAFVGLIARLRRAGVDSISILGSTGCAPYLSQQERAEVTRWAIAAAEGIPVIVGISALSTREVVQLARDAEQAGASGVLLAPFSYQPLTEEEVFHLYETVTHQSSLPLCVYDNPRVTRFEFSDALYARIAELPGVASFKIPGGPANPNAARERVEKLRALLPAHITQGVSGDACAATGLNAGCDAWYSVIGGLFPDQALEITRAEPPGAIALSERLTPLWALFTRFGSLRCIASAAEILGLAAPPCLPAPLRALEGEARQELAEVLKRLGLA
ncbi:dihydrodipicolinate synthase family protein [Enterobacteriaceae bacterium BIT-l23]|uniref:Dihydrodipicolinate synthase family protein n=1 Tax=Jejubacter calystegiae TaxID=2579935 RepID=A0A4P8YUJ0_9ENTR|nr:dihydrodipicolinate synthase family protein [Jejubacter calystegiae]NUU64863.1 dihydrodipicolinate synthase family protein [Enterobacteriaceae bacterium BIT-l23]QCT22672.1 dihydrodipicolinate synthase family protein [Jejubacter calystegiae]